MESVLLDFHIEAGTPKPAILDAYCKQYPQYAHELTDYALEWLIRDSIAGSSKECSEVVNASSSQLVSRAISRLYDRINERDLMRDTTTRNFDNHSHDIFQGLTVVRVRAIRDALGIDTPLFTMFRNRLIDPETIPRPFLDRLTRLLECSAEEVIAYLRLPSMVHAKASFKANEKPAITSKKESFEEAIHASSLSEERKQALLKD
ncbi:MAG: hypothetical protein ACYCRD_02710 [Leptospirillum sp.]